ncbi:MAG: imelysin family protein [Myxococcota bacterium]
MSAGHGFCGVAVAAFIVAACGSTGEEAGRLSIALQSAVDGRIIPAISSFTAEAEAFVDEADMLCSSATPSNLAALQDRWLSMTRQWNRAALYVFGPLDDDPIIPSFIFIESMRQRGIDYTNTVRTTRDAALQGTNVLNDDFFSSLSFNRIGLLALEILAFETSTSTPSSAMDDIVDEYSQQPRKCEYLLGIAQRLADRAQRVRQQWVTDFARTGIDYRTLFFDGNLPSGIEPQAALLVAVIEQLEFIRRRKLEGILDARVATTARPGMRPFFANLSAGLDEVEQLLNAKDAGLSIFDVMLERSDESSVRSVEEQLQTARAVVESDRLDGIAAAFFALETSFRQQIPVVLGVDLGLNFSDGD